MASGPWRPWNPGSEPIPGPSNSGHEPIPGPPNSGHEPIPGLKNVFTLQWRIEQLDFWEEVEPTYYLESPWFYALTLDKGKWRFKLFPKGRVRDNPHIGLTLKSLSNTGVSVNVNCEWCILGSDGSPLSIAILKNQSTYGECELDLPHGPTSEQVFVTQKTTFLPLGNLTLRCRIWGSERDLEDNEYISICTQVNATKDSYRWCIKHFSDLPLMKPLRNLSGFNLAPEARYPVGTKLTLTGESLEDSTIRFEIFLKELKYPLWVKVKLLVFDSNLKVMKSYVKSRNFKSIGTPNDATQIWTIQNLVSRREILMKCLRNDVLTIRFKITFISKYSSLVKSTRRGEEDPDKSILHDISVRDGIVRSNSGGLDISPICTDSIAVLSEDLKHAYENHTDFELRLGDASVHKFVLKKNARSHVFKDKFSRGTTNSNLVDELDLDTSTLDVMRRFLCKGIVADIPWESAIKLYNAADKFQVPSLKRECWNVLRKNITVKNVLEVLKLADRLQNAELTAFARTFIMQHMNEVIHSVEWGKFLVQHPYLPGKTLTAICKRKFKEFRSVSN